MEELEQKATVATLFVERFDDFIERGIHPAIALGLMLAWIWMGLTEGYPAFMDGRVDLASVVILLLCFAGSLFAAGFLKPIANIVGKPVAWLVSAIIVGLACVFLLVLFFEAGSLPEPIEIMLVRSMMPVLGFGSGVLVLCCAAGFAYLRPISAGIAFCAAVMTTFFSYFSVSVCGPQIGGLLFCLLPPLAACALGGRRNALSERLLLQPEEELPFAKGFVSMCISFGVFFFAIGTRCAFEPVSDFATASDTSIIGILLVSMVFLYLIGLREKPVGVFRVLKRSYGFGVITLTVCIALAPLSIEPFVGIVYNADVLVMIAVLWLLTAFVSHRNETCVGKVVAFALGVAALGMAAGWFAGTMMYGLLGHDRSYATIALACATAVFSTVGFSGKSFPYLTKGGEGARKMAKQMAPYEPADYSREVSERCGLSEREAEVLALLVAGYGAEAIADKLIISYHTARTHIRNIYKKVDVHSQRDLLEGYEVAKAQREAAAGE